MIEVHGADGHARFFRELLRSAAGKSMLGPVEPLTELFVGPYADVLERADEWRDKAAKAKVEATARAEVAQAKAKVRAKVAADVDGRKAPPSVPKREPSHWPPRFLLKGQPMTP